MLSRVDKAKPESPFKQTYRGAVSGSNEYWYKFLPWSAHPGRDAVWYEKERAEIAVIEGYLPQAASQDEIDRAVAEAIAQTGATSMKEMGAVMKAVMPRLAGKNADGKAVSETVKKKLTPVS